MSMEKLKTATREDMITVPKALLSDLLKTAQHIEDLVETLEIVGNKELMQNIEQGMKEHREGKTIVAKTPKDIRRILLEK